MEQKQAIADRLKQSNNILVTVSNNPSVDQLASCIGLTLALNKMGKHATAVFSGSVPSTLEFLQPEKTLEKNTDSLRDFIIALDKAKADKLRYKVEDKVVKIFITPYKTSITEKDLDFSQGDFNVDVVVAIGVHQQTDLDQAITSHGRILHDAVVATINTKPGGELGTINWLDPTASSLSELGVQLIDGIDKTMMDGQMATAFLTGIVAETNRFSNEKTTPTTMSISAELMGAGANQQLVATKLEEPPAPPPPPPSAPIHAQGEPGNEEAKKEEAPHTAEDGTLEITHTHDEEAEKTPPPPAPEPEHEKEPELPPTPQIRIDDQGSLRNIEHIDNHGSEPLLGGVQPGTDPLQHMASSHMILEPPLMGGQLTANSVPEDEDGADPLSLPQPSEPTFGGSSFGPPPASAATTAAAMPYMPPSMTPGGAAPAPAQPAPAPLPPAAPAPPAPTPPAPVVPVAAAQQVFQPQAPAPALEPPAAPEPPSETLSQIEADVNSPHLVAPTPLATTPAPAPVVDATPVVPSPQNVAPTIMPPAPAFTPPAPAPAPQPSMPPAPEPTSPDLASARDAVMQAITGQPQSAVAPEPIQALNAQPLGTPLHEDPSVVAPAPPVNLDATANPTFTLPDVDASASNGAAPPAVPPPMMPPNFGQ